jgi:hypothetical protein
VQCPLYPRKRTSVERSAMSAMCQKQTFAPPESRDPSGRGPSSEIFLCSWRQTAFFERSRTLAQVSKITFTQMPGNWTYNELLPIGGFGLTTLGRAALRLHRASHRSFPLRCNCFAGILSRPRFSLICTTMATRFLNLCPSTRSDPSSWRQLLALATRELPRQHWLAIHAVVGLAPDAALAAD